MFKIQKALVPFRERGLFLFQTGIAVRLKTLLDRAVGNVSILTDPEQSRRARRAKDVPSVGMTFLQASDVLKCCG